MITIEGSNLGIREEDVRGKIRIGDIPCELVNYEISVKIECRTGPVNYEITAPVKVGNDAGYTESSVQFQYKDVKLEGLYPAMGPQSGGTKLSIIGKYLNIGSSITAYLDEYECVINMTQASSSRLTCITSASRQPEHIRVLMLSIDGANRTYSCSTSQKTYHKNYIQVQRSNIVCSIFNYTVDPKIMQIKPLKSFASGGRMVTVHGTNLDAIQKPEIEVYFEDKIVNKSTCSVINSNQMECPSPAVTKKFLNYKKNVDQFGNSANGGNGSGPNGDYETTTTVRRRRRKLSSSPHDSMFTTINYYSSSSPSSNDVAALKIREIQLILQISFIMDNVESVKDLNKHFQSLRSSMVYVEDPNFFSFANGMKLYKGDTLVIEGEHLNIASDETDVNVTIGMQQCNVTSLALTQLVCTPPEKQPLPTDENGLEVKINKLIFLIKL